MIKYLEKENLNDIIKKDTWIVDSMLIGVALVKMLGTVLETMNENILKINVDNHQDLATTYGVMSIPTICFFKEGKLKQKVVGFRSKEEIEEILSQIKN